MAGIKKVIGPCSECEAFVQVVKFGRGPKQTACENCGALAVL